MRRLFEGGAYSSKYGISGVVSFEVFRILSNKKVSVIICNIIWAVKIR